MQIGQTVAEIFPIFDFSRYRLSTILDLLSAVWTIHESYLVVVVTVQNFVGFGAVVSIICKF